MSEMAGWGRMEVKVMKGAKEVGYLLSLNFRKGNTQRIWYPEETRLFVAIRRSYGWIKSHPKF